DNALTQVRDVARVLGGRLPPVQHGGASSGWVEVLGSVPANRLLRGSEREALARWLEQKDAAVRAARLMAGFRDGRLPVEAADNPLMTTFPDLQAWRDVIHLLALDAEGHIQAGKAAEAVESVRAMYTAARAFRDEPFLVAQFGRVSGNARATRQLERILATS